MGFWQFLDRETAFHSLWTADHLIPLFAEDEDAPCFEAWTATAVAAQATERLRLGCVVTGVTLRHPSVIAKAAATIDHVSQGRLELGLGTAWHGGEHDTFGIPFPSAGEREDMLEEAVQVIRLLFSNRAPVDFSGRYYRLRQATMAPPCLQQPHPPIIVGGGGERRTLRTVARFADAANVIGGVSTARRKFAILDQHCAREGRDPTEIVRTVVAPIHITDDPGEASRVHQRLAVFTGGDSSDDVAIGSAGQVHDVLARYADEGVSRVVMISLPPFDFEQYRRVSELAATFS
ncbi:MAG: LLM class flavin-dependent oxidoreductase [Dehalococcoidia bacterium]